MKSRPGRSHSTSLPPALYVAKATPRKAQGRPSGQLRHRSGSLEYHSPLGGFVAQWSRARASEARGRGFDSLLAQFLPVEVTDICWEGLFTYQRGGGVKKACFLLSSLWYTRDGK